MIESPASRLLQVLPRAGRRQRWRPMKSPRVIALLLTLALSVTVVGADKRPLTPQDLWAVKRLSSPAVSPDGKTVVFTIQEWSIEKNKSTSSLWLVDTAGGAPRRLTDRKSTRLNSSHQIISYAVFCLKKKKRA